MENAGELIEKSFDNTCYTSTFTVNLLFSLKRRKFIKPIRAKHLVLRYAVFPGTYLLISTGGHLSTKIREWVIRKIRIKEDGNYETLESAVWRLDSRDYPQVPKILKVISMPRYHGYPSAPWDEEFTEEDIAHLMKGGTIVNVEEYT
jgi:hypothetical protein